MKIRCVMLVLLLIVKEMAECRLRHRSLRGDCKRCSPGWGVVKPCASPTVCQPCTSGTYSPHHSYLAPCWPCSRCGPGLYEAHPCTITSDTVCDSCQRLRDVNHSRHCH